MANYTAGTITVTEGSNVVTGVGTRWTYVAIQGRYLTVPGLKRPYQVALVVSDTEILVTRPISLTGDEASGFALTNQAYSIPDSFTPNISAPIIRKDDIDKVPRFVRGFNAIDQMKRYIDGYQKREGIYTPFMTLDLSSPGNFDFFGAVDVAPNASLTPQTLDMSSSENFGLF